jgi:hypothetical protein
LAASAAAFACELGRLRGGLAELRLRLRGLRQRTGGDGRAVPGGGLGGLGGLTGLHQRVRAAADALGDLCLLLTHQQTTAPRRTRLASAIV